MSDITETVDAEIVDQFTTAHAHQIDRDIRGTVDQLHSNWDHLAELVTRAKWGNVHIVLGYETWPAYLADAVRVQPSDTPQRQQLVAMLSGEGLSQRAIGAMVGSSQMTVQRDLAEQGDSDVSPAESVGVDGKKYQRKRETPEPDAEQDDEPTPPVGPHETVTGAAGNREALRIEFRDAVTDLVSDVQLLGELARRPGFGDVSYDMHIEYGADIIGAIDGLGDIHANL